MYRLVKFPQVKFRKSVTRTFQLNSNVCSLCGTKTTKLISNLKIGAASANVLITREHTTNTDVMYASDVIKRKRFRSNKKFFTELLEVFGNNLSSKPRLRKPKLREVPCITISPNLKESDFNKIMKNLKLNQNEIIATGTEGSFSVFDLSEGKKLNENYKLEPNDSSITDAYKVLPSEEVNSFYEPKVEGNSVGIKTPGVEYEKDIHGHKVLQFSLNESLTGLQETNIPGVLNIPLASSHCEESIIDEYENHSEDGESELVPSETLENLEPKPEKKEKRKKIWHRTTKEKLAKENMSDLERKMKEKAFNTTLYAFLNICVNCNFLQRSLSTLNYHMNNSRRSVKNPKITDIKIFEVVMRGFAVKGNQHKVNEILKMMSSAGLKPSLDVFAARLECAARSHKNQNLVPGIIRELNEMGYNLNDIFLKCTFLGDQRNVILKAIQEVEKSFAPVIPPPAICYSCSLLQEIDENQERNKQLNSPAEGLFTKDDLRNFAEEQLKNEFSFHLKVQSIEKKMEPEGVLEMNRQKLNSMQESWLNELKNGFDREITLLEMTKKPNSLCLLPYMKVLDPDSYIDIMMNEIQRLAEGSETFSPSTYQLHRYMGNEVRNRFEIKYKQTHGIADKTKMLYDKYCDWYLNSSINELRSCNGRQEWQQLVHEHQNGPSIVGSECHWPITVLIGIGKFLYNIILGDVKIDVNILNKTSKQHMLPAFYRVYRQQGVKSVEEIKPHPVISKLYRAASGQHIIFDITHVPMLSPPLPWTSHKAGGYLTAKTDLLRLPDKAFLQKQRLREAPPQQLYPPLDSLNQLGSIPWIVNKPVLDTVIEVFNNGGSAKLEIPEPSYLSPVPEPVRPDMTKEERYQAYRQRLLLRRQKAEMYSLWCDALYKLSLANHFRDRVFWLPHNMDFRGRVYPCPPHLNHLGADMPRSLLCFAKGKSLGPDGLDWLKIHLVNLIGTKKRDSVLDRLAYANSILTDILDSAEKPLTGGKWWMESETPWQTLACCKEIHAALQHPEGPQHFISHFPVHQDGSCNGLQHYAALGRDEAGASSVNLVPHDTPQDVYSCVAAMVEHERAKDSAAGLKVAQELDGFVRRKVIKQTVMTTVYGVTRFGARLQIAKQLKDIESFPKESVWPASTYLVAKTFESLREMFNSTREIQDWFTECARQVSHVCGENMEYVTPLGLPVVQHYTRQIKPLDCTVSKVGQMHEYFPMDIFERPNVMKQKNAFPPNFIHSLDSSHMMLTSIFSEQKGITFVSVHDCYWTHASTVPIMNQICREQFVALHSQPILEDLSAYMLKRYGHDERERMDQNALSQFKQNLHNVLTQVPPKGKFILENVLDSIYFFS